MTDIPPIPGDPAELKAWADNLSPDALKALTQGLLNGPLTAGDDDFMFPRNRPIELAPPPTRPTMLTVTMELRGSKPRIWRRLVLPGNLSLDALHPLLQAAMGWSDSHLHRFHPGVPSPPNQPYFITAFDEEEGDEGTREADARLDQVLRMPGDRLTYLYDFGDGWEHVIVLESLAEVAEYGQPQCIKGAMACPHEDVGGIHAHNDVVQWLRNGCVGPLPAFSESAEQLLTWLGADYDPDAFSPEEATEDMRLWAAGEHLPWHGLPPRLVELITTTRGISPLVYDWLSRLGPRTPVELSEEEVNAAAHPWYVILHAIWPKVTLTAAGYLPPAVVREIAEDLGVTRWWIGKANREDGLPPVAQLREAAQGVGLLRKTKGTLAPTARAEKMRKDPAALVKHVLSRLPVGKGFDAEAAWYYLLVTATGNSRPDAEVAQALNDRGWRVDGSLPVGPSDAHYGLRGTQIPLRWMTGSEDLVDSEKMTRFARAALFGFVQV